MGGVVSNPRSLAESSCLWPGIEIEEPGARDVFTIMANAVGARSTPTTGTILVSSGKILKSTIVSVKSPRKDFRYSLCTVIIA